MTPLTERLITEKKTNRILTERQLARLLGGSNARRYGIVNRALKAGELLRVRRGMYVMAPQFRNYPVHLFALAQQLLPGSYVSAETALSFHSWIPETVHTVLSVTHGGKSVDYRHDIFGHFEFHRMAVRSGYFLQSVHRHELQQQVALIAEPLRALMDLIVLRKQNWQGLNYLLDGLRIDEEVLMEVPTKNIHALKDIYKGKRERHFIDALVNTLNKQHGTEALNND